MLVTISKIPTLFEQYSLNNSYRGWCCGHYFGLQHKNTMQLLVTFLSRSKMHLCQDVPPITNADGEPHYDPHEDDVDTPTIVGIRRAETSVRNDKRRARKPPANDDDAAPSAKGVFFRNFPVSIEPLPSQKRGAALSSAN
jgi:hypothetical protein